MGTFSSGGYPTAYQMNICDVTKIEVASSFHREFSVKLTWDGFNIEDRNCSADTVWVRFYFPIFHINEKNKRRCALTRRRYISMNFQYMICV